MPFRQKFRCNFGPSTATPRPPSEQEKRALNCSVTGAFVVRPPSHRIQPPDEGGRDEGEARARRRKRVVSAVLWKGPGTRTWHQLKAPRPNLAESTKAGRFGLGALSWCQVRVPGPFQITADTVQECKRRTLRIRFTLQVSVPVCQWQRQSLG